MSVKQGILDVPADFQICLRTFFQSLASYCAAPSKKRLGSLVIGPGSGPDDPGVCSTLLSCRTPLEMIIAIVMSPSPDICQA